MKILLIPKDEINNHIDSKGYLKSMGRKSKSQSKILVIDILLQ